MCHNQDIGPRLQVIAGTYRFPHGSPLFQLPPAGKHILITSGPTRANLDAVRFISNRSSGRLGRKMALEALGRGAQVTFVAGPDSVVPAPEDLIEEDRARLRVLMLMGPCWYIASRMRSRPFEPRS